MRYNTKYRPVSKKYQIRKTLYGKIWDALQTGNYRDYEKVLSPLENCKDKTELKDIITNLMRDYLFQFKREKYLPTPRQKFEQLFRKV